MPRPISEIATDVRAHWPKVYLGAVPYLEAMETLTSVDEMYYMDTARSVLLYFLANAQAWRGPDARRIKAEIREMLK